MTIEAGFIIGFMENIISCHKDNIPFMTIGTGFIIGFMENTL
jgi:hypothetical protein